MYQRILLAYDGSLEGRAALREGALLAKRCGATVYLLSVTGNAGVSLAEGAYPGALTEHQVQLKSVFDEGVARLTALGLSPIARLVAGDPTERIREFAAEVSADLVVVGHRKKSLLERWWSGPTGAYLVDQIGCSLLVSRNVITDEVFEKEFSNSPDRRPSDG
jgi:nucleotide-binding universal stress UspA family protein